MEFSEEWSEIFMLKEDARLSKKRIFGLTLVKTRGIQRRFI